MRRHILLETSALGGSSVPSLAARRVGPTRVAARCWGASSEVLRCQRSQGVSDRVGGPDLAAPKSAQHCVQSVTEPSGWQGDLVFDGAGLAFDGSNANVAVLQEPEHGLVVGRYQGGEASDSFMAGAISEPVPQLGAESLALPLVDDGDGNLGSVGSWGASVSRM